MIAASKRLQRAQRSQNDAELINLPDSEASAAVPDAAPVVSPPVAPAAEPAAAATPLSVPPLAVPALTRPGTGGQGSRTRTRTPALAPARALAAPQVHIGQVNVVVRAPPEQKPASSTGEAGPETAGLQLLRGL